MPWQIDSPTLWHHPIAISLIVCFGAAIPRPTVYPNVVIARAIGFVCFYIDRFFTHISRRTGVEKQQEPD